MGNTKRQPWEARSFAELQELTTLEAILKALYAAEKNRQYHKTQYLKKASILEKAKAAGITAD